MSFSRYYGDVNRSLHLLRVMYQYVRRFCAVFIDNKNIFPVAYRRKKNFISCRFCLPPQDLVQERWQTATFAVKQPATISSSIFGRFQQNYLKISLRAYSLEHCFKE